MQKSFKGVFTSKGNHSPELGMCWKSSGNSTKIGVVRVEWGEGVAVGMETRARAGLFHAVQALEGFWGSGRERHWRVWRKVM